jgi:hypothetical protein
MGSVNGQMDRSSASSTNSPQVFSLALVFHLHIFYAYTDQSPKFWGFRGNLKDLDDPVQLQMTSQELTERVNDSGYNQL